MRKMSLLLATAALAATVSIAVAQETVPRMQGVKYEIDKVPYFSSETVLGENGPIVMLQCRRAISGDNFQDRKNGFACRTMASPASPFQGAAIR